MIKKILRIIFIKFIPVKKNRIVFTSYSGQYSDSPKCVFEKMVTINKKHELVWLVSKKNINKIPNGIKAIDINSFKGIYYYGSASIIIDNNYGGKSVTLNGNKFKNKIVYNIERFFKKKRKQYVYTFWHGTPLKKMARDQINLNITNFDCDNTTMILGNKYILNIMDHLCFNKIKMKLMGTPRNDILFYNDKNMINNMKKQLQLPLDKKIVLFAPSFRTDSNNDKNVQRSGINQLKEINFDKLFKILHDKFGGEWIFICRFHHNVSKLVDWDQLEEKYGDKIINGNKYENMNDYLLCTDILLSDVSSCLFDFMHTNRPSFIYFPDLNYYQEKERGLYYPLDKLPFPFAINFNQLIESIKKFDNSKFKRDISALKKEFGYVDKKNSSEIIAKYILEDCDKHEKNN